MSTRTLPTDTTSNNGNRNIKKQKKSEIINVKVGKKDIAVDKGDYETIEAIKASASDSPHYHPDFESVKFDVDGDEKRVISLNIQTLAFDGGLPKEIGNLSELKQLRVENLYFYKPARASGIYPPMPLLKNLEELHIDCFPQDIGNLKNLKVLKLGWCRELKELPEEIGDLETLEELSVEYSKITTIPSSIGKLKNLKYLHLRCDKLQQVPNDIGNLTNLKNLDLSDCHELKKLPEEIGNLENLKKLQVISCRVSKLPSSIGKLKNLEYIGLHSNKTEGFPEELWDLPKLRKLDLVFNKVLIPPSIGRLQSLEKLNLLGNSKIRTLPDEIGNLANLKILSLFDVCNVESLPSSMRNLKKLEHLTLAHMDRLRKLPDFLGELENLKSLNTKRMRISRKVKKQRVLDLLKTLPYLGDVDSDIEDDLDLDYPLAYNRYKLRNPFVGATLEQKKALGNLWPRMLGRAVHAFARNPGDWNAYNLTRPYDAMYQILLDGRESFAYAIRNRNNMNCSNSSDSEI